MDESKLAAAIAEKVISDTNFWIALVGIIGGVVGSLLTFLGNFLIHQHQAAPERRLENSRIAMLKEMLNDERFPDKWRSLTTLSSVIGADKEATKRLLFKAGARGSEKADGKWGLVKNHPLPNAE